MRPALRAIVEVARAGGPAAVERLKSSERELQRAAHAVLDEGPPDVLDVLESILVGASRLYGVAHKRGIGPVQVCPVRKTGIVWVGGEGLGRKPGDLVIVRADGVWR